MIDPRDIDAAEIREAHLFASVYRHPDWRWMPGMLLGSTSANMSSHRTRIAERGRDPITVHPSYVPILGDAATGGCLLALLWRHRPDLHVHNSGIVTIHDEGGATVSEATTLGRAVLQVLAGMWV